MQNINDFFEAYIAEENPIKKEFLLNMYNHALQQKQKEVISQTLPELLFIGVVAILGYFSYATCFATNWFLNY